jgi:hypothetical protein
MQFDSKLSNSGNNITTDSIKFEMRDIQMFNDISLQHERNRIGIPMGSAPSGVFSPIIYFFAYLCKLCLFVVAPITLFLYFAVPAIIPLLRDLLTIF